MKWWRRKCYKAERAYWRTGVYRDQVQEGIYKHPNTFYNSWDSPQDGKGYWQQPHIPVHKGDAHNRIFGFKAWTEEEQLEHWQKSMRK